MIRKYFRQRTRLLDADRRFARDVVYFESIQVNDQVYVPLRQTKGGGSQLEESETVRSYSR